MPGLSPACRVIARLAKQKRERLRSAHLAPDYVPLGGAAGLANLEARLKPEGGIQQMEAAQAGSEGSDEEGNDRRMTFVGDLRRRTAAGDALADSAAEPQASASSNQDYQKLIISLYMPSAHLPFQNCRSGLSTTGHLLKWR